MNRVFWCLGWLVLLSRMWLATAAASQPEEAYAAFLRADYQRAHDLLVPLAEQGVPQAQYYLGLMYDMGNGLPRDHTSAARWYRSAAGTGLAPAQFNLGLMYESGEGVQQDYIEAYKWLELAARHSANAQRGEALKVRDRVAGKMTPAEMAEARHRASQWTPGAALRYRHPPKTMKPPTTAK